MSEPDLFAHLSADADVATLIGDRVFPDKIPQHHYDGARTMPCCTFQLAGADRQVKYCATDGLAGGSYQLDIYTPVFDDLPSIARAIRRRMVDYSGAMGQALVSKVLLENEFNVPPEPDPGLYRRTQLYTIWFNED